MKERLLELLTARFGNSLIEHREYRGELTVTVAKGALVEICRFLRDDDELRFDSFRDVCGADYYRPENRFEVIYNIYSLKNSFRLRLKVLVPEEDLRVPTVTGIWPGAEWPERETYDMYGIQFDGHPDLRRMYMPEEFEHFPLRKDFPLMGIPGSLPLPRK